MSSKDRDSTSFPRSSSGESWIISRIASSSGKNGIASIVSSFLAGSRVGNETLLPCNQLQVIFSSVERRPSFEIVFFAFILVIIPIAWASLEEHPSVYSILYQVFLSSRLTIGGRKCWRRTYKGKRKKERGRSGSETGVSAYKGVNQWKLYLPAVCSQCS
jgi:hypothetical protein